MNDAGTVYTRDKHAVPTNNKCIRAMDYEKSYLKMLRTMAILRALKTNTTMQSKNLEDLPDDVLELIFFKKHKMEMKEAFETIREHCRLGTRPFLTLSTLPEFHFSIYTKNEHVDYNCRQFSIYLEMLRNARRELNYK